MNNIFRSKKRVLDDESHPTRFYSDRQEKNVAKIISGKQTKNSGATQWQKTDILTENWGVECKTCEKHQKSFSIKKEWLEKNKEEANFMNKQYSVLVFNFGPDEKNYAVIDLDLFNIMKDALNIVENGGNIINENNI